MHRILGELVQLSIAVVLFGALVVSLAPKTQAIEANERTLSIFNIHNGERITILFKKDGKYIPEALQKLNHFFRDWRTNEQTTMDAELFDIIWELHAELGSQKPVHLVSGYRSPTTNEKLRKSGGGQAKKSQHTRGQAADIHFPDVPVQRIRYSALVRERGGVGYYPTSALPFVHVDTGRVRMWPRMPRQELALLFPNGRSKYLPNDGKPITPADVTAARANYKQLASAIAAFHQFRAGASERTVVASLESKVSPVAQSDVGADEEDESLENQGTANETLSAAPVAVAALESGVPTLDGPALTDAPVPAKPQVQLAKAESVPRPVQAKRGLQIASLGDLPSTKTQRNGLGAFIAGLDIGATVTKQTADAADDTIVPTPEPITQQAFLSREGWASAPEYDEEHSNELSYRAFPLGPLLTRDAKIESTMLATLRAPDLVAARDLIGRSDGLGLGFAPRWQVAELAWGGTLTTEDLSLVLRTAPPQSRVVQTAIR